MDPEFHGCENATLVLFFKVVLVNQPLKVKSPQGKSNCSDEPTKIYGLNFICFWYRSPSEILIGIKYKVLYFCGAHHIG